MLFDSYVRSISLCTAVSTSCTQLVHAWIKFFERNGTDHAHLLFLATGLTDDTQKKKITRIHQTKQQNIECKQRDRKRCYCSSRRLFQPETLARTRRTDHFSSLDSQVHMLLAGRVSRPMGGWDYRRHAPSHLVYDIQLQDFGSIHSSCFTNLSTQIFFVASFLYDPLFIAQIRLYLHGSPDSLRLLRISCWWLSTLLMFS